MRVTGCLFIDAAVHRLHIRPGVSTRGPPHRVRIPLELGGYVRRIGVSTTLLLALCLCSTKAAAQRRITGRVVEEGGTTPLPSVTVIIPGTTTAAVTNDNGTFALLVPAGDVQLSARRIGYKRKTFTVRFNQSDVQVGLERDPFRLETQIVTGAATTVARQ